MQRPVGVILKAVLLRLPVCLFETIYPYLMKIFDPTSLSQITYHRVSAYADYLYNNFDREVKRIIQKKRFMVIEKGYFEFPYFNGFYLNNMISLIFYSLYHHYIPIISINKDKPDSNKWEWYFLQPCYYYISDTDTKKWKRVICSVQEYSFAPHFQDAFDVNSKWFRFWNFMYSKFAVFNDDTETYINQEICSFGNMTDTIAVILRGTDYEKKRPSMHPIQPSIEDVAFYLQKEIHNKHYQKIYIATEEKRLFLELQKHFDSYQILSNERTYYDEYYDKQCEYIQDIHFNRENDNFLKGLQYLSSMVIVSQCPGFVGGNSGGTLMSLLFRKDGFNRVQIINRGFYP